MDIENSIFHKLQVCPKEWELYFGTSIYTDHTLQHTINQLIHFKVKQSCIAQNVKYLE